VPAPSPAAPQAPPPQRCGGPGQTKGRWADADAPVIMEPEPNTETNEVDSTGFDGATCQGQGRRPARRRTRHCALLVATHLNRLDHVDPKVVVSVRRLARLGFGAEDAIRSHFSKFGSIDDVLLSGSQDRQQAPNRGGQSRLRPSGFGFVVFDDVSSAERAVDAGADQFVSGCEISVQRFRRRSEGDDGCGHGDADENEQVEEKPEPAPEPAAREAALSHLER